DASIVALVRATSATIAPAVALRVPSSFAAALTGYVLRLNGTDLQILKANAGAYSVVEDTAFPVAEGEDVWIRFDAANVSSGVLTRGKAWRGTISDEPADYMVSFEDTVSPHPDAGLAGLAGPESAGAVVSFACGYFRIRSLFGSTVETLRHAMPANYL